MERSTLLSTLLYSTVYHYVKHRKVDNDDLLQVIYIKGLHSCSDKFLPELQIDAGEGEKSGRNWKMPLIESLDLS